MSQRMVEDFILGIQTSPRPLKLDKALELLQEDEAFHGDYLNLFKAKWPTVQKDLPKYIDHFLDASSDEPFEKMKEYHQHINDYLAGVFTTHIDVEDFGNQEWSDLLLELEDLHEEMDEWLASWESAKKDEKKELESDASEIEEDLDCLWQELTQYIRK